MGILILLVLLNLMISAFNAWSCGRAWPESKRIGGWTRFMTWMGAIMSAVGFTWCYLVIAAFVAVANESLTPEQAQAAFDLGYLALLVPCIGSGTAVTVNSWIAFRRYRSLSNGAIAAWNTAADVHNIYSAATHAPKAWDNVAMAFKGRREGNELIVMLVACVALAGVITTALIIRLVSQRREAELRMAALAQ